MTWLKPFIHDVDNIVMSIHALLVESQGKRIIVDHVSASWGIDENLSGGSAFKDVTVQYCIIAEGLWQTGLWHGECNEKYEPGGEKGHSMGSLFKPSSGDGDMSIHHNLFAHNGNRNPAVGSYDSDQSFRADIRNNVIYNAEGKTNLAHGRFALIGNYYRPGPNTDITLYPIGPKTVEEDATYGTLAGNTFEGHADWTEDNYLAVEWGVRGGNYLAEVIREEFTLATQPVAEADRPATDSAGDAYERGTLPTTAPIGVGLGLPAIGAPAPLPVATGCSV